MGVAAYWLLGEDTHAERLFARVELLPDELATQPDPVARAVQMAYRARRTVAAVARGHLSPATGQSASREALRLCDAAGRYLEDSLAYWSCKQPNDLVLVRTPSPCSHSMSRKDYSRSPNVLTFLILF